MPAEPFRLDTLRLRRDFLAASRDGVKIGGPIIGLQMRDRGAPETPARVGFTATKRVGGAVERNRMKRRLRAAARSALAEVARPGCDYVVIARRAVLDAAFDRILRDLREAAKRAHGREKRTSPAPAGSPSAPIDGRESGR
ncbi:ribonuclease P protein component [Hansschlegelia plantiphila]|uniref:Ribonuclease P protein component n=1 Tax=Hansschlegelia plantiphila TaxID=374655 RepID=A0A9W6J3V7_9HYPH|nr:ribonuclease P protein component [Hansschlegelia plantiphila]GLK68849.1 ribonuclease P protein component [Hansschlegelia plantiphila]